MEIKAADGASERYLGDLRSRLRQFAADFNGKPVAEITATEVDEWLRSLSDKESGKPLAATTRNNFRRVLIVAFNFARERGYCVGNPAEKSAKAKEVEGVVGILTVEQTAALLENSPAELVPYIAIGAFAGLRRAELERFDWREVDLESGLIEVTASKSKSARRRFVKVQPNLAAWLKPYAQLRGNVTPRISANYSMRHGRTQRSTNGRRTRYVKFRKLSSRALQRCGCARAGAWPHEQQSRVPTLPAARSTEAGRAILEHQASVCRAEAGAVSSCQRMKQMHDHRHAQQQSNSGDSATKLGSLFCPGG